MLTLGTAGIEEIHGFVTVDLPYHRTARRTAGGDPAGGPGPGGDRHGGCEAAAVLDFLLDNVTDDPSTYLLLSAIILIDDFVPFAPGDTAMITAGIIAANGGLVLYLVILAGTIGGMLGDNLVYFLAQVRPPPRRPLLGNPHGRERYRWAERQISIRGPTIIVVGRFIPGGRAVTTFACGTTEFAYRRFLLADSISGIRVGQLHGRCSASPAAPTFRDSLWQPLLIGLGVAFVLGSAAEALRRMRA